MSGGVVLFPRLLLRFKGFQSLKQPPHYNKVRTTNRGE